MEEGNNAAGAIMIAAAGDVLTCSCSGSALALQAPLERSQGACVAGRARRVCRRPRSRRPCLDLGVEPEHRHEDEA